MDLPVSEEPLEIVFRLDGAEKTETLVVKEAEELAVDLREEISALDSASKAKAIAVVRARRVARRQGQAYRRLVSLHVGADIPEDGEAEEGQELRTDVKDPFAG